MITERLSLWNKSILVSFTRYWTTFHSFVQLLQLLHFALMMSQFLVPELTLNQPDQCKSFVWESHIRQQFFVVFEDFYY